MQSFGPETWGEFRGQWVAVKDGDVLAHHAELRGVYAALDRDPEECDYVAQVPPSGSFEEFERAARAAHVEFRRRLRG